MRFDNVSRIRPVLLTITWLLLLAPFFGPTGHRIIYVLVASLTNFGQIFSTYFWQASWAMSSDDISGFPHGEYEHHSSGGLVKLFALGIAIGMRFIATKIGEVERSALAAAALCLALSEWRTVTVSSLTVAQMTCLALAMKSVQLGKSHLQGKVVSPYS